MAPPPFLATGSASCTFLAPALLGGAALAAFLDAAGAGASEACLPKLKLKGGGFAGGAGGGGGGRAGFGPKLKLNGGGLAGGAGGGGGGGGFGPKLKLNGDDSGAVGAAFAFGTAFFFAASLGFGAGGDRMVGGLGAGAFTTGGAGAGAGGDAGEGATSDSPRLART